MKVNVHYTLVTEIIDHDHCRVELSAEKNISILFIYLTVTFGLEAPSRK